MGTGDDLKIGESQEAEDGTELLARSRLDGQGNPEKFNNPSIFHVKDELLPLPAGTTTQPQFVSGIQGIAPHGFGIIGEGFDGVHGDGAGSGANDGLGVVGKGSGVGVVGQLTDQPQPLPIPLLDAGVVGSTLGLADTERAKNSAGVVGESDAGYGVYGVTNSGIAVRGDAETLAGVMGESAEGDGVFGVGNNTGVRGSGPVGVLGEGDRERSQGVVGNAELGIGVHGRSNDGRGLFGTGVYGEGVGGAGVVGYAAHGIGVQGQSDRHIGVLGLSIDASGNPGFAAGYFLGPVIVDGDFTVVGAKHAAIRHRDGSHRLLYSIESPESWFEDFGEAKLVKGKADVKLDPAFASTVKLDTYHVFITPYEDSHGLFVSRRDEKGFEVREQGKGSNNIRFSYRVVAKRRDIDGTRLARVKFPRVRPVRPEPSTLPGRPDVPPRPSRRERGVRPPSGSSPAGRARPAKRGPRAGR